MSKGMFIAFEGPDGVGKTSTIEGVAKELQKRGYGPEEIITVIDPGTSTLGEAIRPILKGGQVPMAPFTQMMLFIACRVQMAQEIIIPALQQGKVVLCDRYTMSTIVYQVLAGNKKWEPMQKVIHDTELVIPSVYVILNAEFSVLRSRRLASRWCDYFNAPETLEVLVKAAQTKKRDKLIELLKEGDLELLKEGDQEEPEEIAPEDLADSILLWAKDNQAALRKHARKPEQLPLDHLKGLLCSESIVDQIFGQWKAWKSGQLEEAVELVADGRFDDDNYQKAVAGAYYAAPSLIQGEAPVIREDTTNSTPEDVVKRVTDTLMKLKNG